MIKVIKRDGKKVDYDGFRIKNAISKAMIECNKSEKETVSTIEQKVFEELSNNNDIKIYQVEEIQDMVESLLMDSDNKDVAKRYILYREKRNEARNQGWNLKDLPKAIFEQKYEFEKEGFDGFLDRVSCGNDNIKKLIRDKKFIPAGRILANRGLQNKGKKVTYSNCYVITPPEDNIESIFDTGKSLARTFSYGGGCGIDIGKLRPDGAKVNNSANYTTGACSFMDLYSHITGLIAQKGRRGALMISIPCDHPDIEQFIHIKSDLDKVTKANISIRIKDDFMNAVINKEKYMLEFKVDATGETISKEVDAHELFEKFAKMNWDYAEPGALFWDNIENWNVCSGDDEFEYAGTNPCAEEPLPSGGSCLLGSINLSEFVTNEFGKHASFNYQSFGYVVRQAVRYLNEVLDEGLPLHPLKEQRETVRDWRQIGLGIMGIADMLIKLNIKYGSDESLRLCDEIGKIMINEAIQQSSLLAKESGSYPKFKLDKILQSDFIQSNCTSETIKLIKEYGLRNSQLLTIAPTGSISTMLGISGGIEPIYMISYTRKTETLNDGEDTFYKVFTPIAQRYMEYHNIKDEEDLPEIFITAMGLDYKERIKMQSTWQRYIDASISSTINVDKDFTVEDCMDVYIQAWRHKLKGVTIFRDGCKRLGILGNHDANSDDVNSMSAKELQELLDKKIQEELENDPNKCPKCGGKMIFTGGCSECEECAYSPCAV